MKKSYVAVIIMTILGSAVLIHQITLGGLGTDIQLTMDHAGLDLDRLDPFPNKNEQIYRLADPVFDTSDNLVVAGSTNSSHAFVAFFDTGGGHRRTVLFDGNFGDQILQVLVTGTNEYIVVGTGTGAASYWNVEPQPGWFNQDTLDSGATYVFVMKLTINGDIVWSRSYGGSSGDRFDYAILDGNDNIIISGNTYSRDLPGAGTYTPSISMSMRYVAKFSSDGIFQWGRFWEPNDGDPAADGKSISDIEVDSQGNVFLISNRLSKFLANGTMAWSTSFGNNISDSYQRLDNIAVDSDDALLISGETQNADFPITEGAFDTTIGIRDNFLVKLTTDGTIIWSTFIGTNQFSFSIPPTDVQVDRYNNIYVVGQADTDTFYTHPDPLNQNASTIFLLKVAPTGTLEWKIPVGGDDEDIFSNLAVASDYEIGFEIDRNNLVVITGTTSSTNIPTRGELQEDNSGFSDGFVMKYNGNATLVYSTYLGSENREIVETISVGPSNTIVVTGHHYANGTEFTQDEGHFIIMFDDTGYVAGYNAPHSDTSLFPAHIPSLAALLVVIASGTYLAAKREHTWYSPDDPSYPRITDK